MDRFDLHPPARPAPAVAPGGSAAGLPDSAWLAPYKHALDKLHHARDVERGDLAEDVSPLGWVS